MGITHYVSRITHHSLFIIYCYIAEVSKLKFPKHHRVITITIRQFLGLMLVAIATFIAVFYIGVQIGKQRVINAEREAQKQDEIKALARIDKSVKIAKDTFFGQKQGGKVNTLDSLPIKEIPKKIAQIDDKKPKQTQDRQPELKKQKNKEKTEKKALIYTIKIGSFGTEENANNLANNIRQIGYEPIIKPDGELFHITVGKFENEDEARKFGDSLMKKVNNIGGYIIKVYE